MHFLGQEKILSSIDNKYEKWEELVKMDKIEKAQILGNEIKENCKKLFPTLELIQKVNNIDNVIALSNSKKVAQDNEITNLEKEILQKIA